MRNRKHLVSNPFVSLEDKSEFAELILDVFDCVLFVPGDWHTGMDMMQSIYNIYWHLLLKHMKSWLKDRMFVKGYTFLLLQSSQAPHILQPRVH